MIKIFLLLISLLSSCAALNRPVRGTEVVLNSHLETNLKRVLRVGYRTLGEYVDFSVDPCEDFFKHACGNWDKLNPMPDDVVDFRPIKALSYSMELLLGGFLSEDGEDFDNSSAVAKARRHFYSCSNQRARDELSTKPIVEFMETLGGWPVLKPNWTAEDFDWLTTIAVMRRYGDQILIKENVNTNKKNSNHSIIYLDQPGLGLGSRADYLDSIYKFRLDAYKNYIEDVLKLFGKSRRESEQTAEEIIAFEAKLALILVPSPNRQNISLFSSEVSISELQLKVPDIDWTRYLTTVLERSVDPSEPVVIKELNYMNDMFELVNRTESRIVANYIFWRFAQFKVAHLSSNFEEPLQRYYKILLGRKATQYSMRTCAKDVSNHMREVVGAIFTKYLIKDTHSDEVVKIIEDLKVSFAEIINGVDWLDEYTKNLIRRKLKAMRFQIGYPAIVRYTERLDELYVNLTVVADRYFENYLNLLKYSTGRRHSRLYFTGAEDEWSNVSPDLVNAYYNPTKNKIVIPAGLLQQPFFHEIYPTAIKYGRMGSLIGHEITHAFDNIGRNFDFDGNLKPWWNQTLIDTFNQKSGCIADQYSQYRIPDSKHLVDPVGTLAENIADNAGLEIAFRAYKMKSIDDVDYTEEMFFYSFAQLWCGDTRPEAVLTQARRDPHSPAMWRVIGTLSNSPNFSRVFNCSTGSRMNPIKKCKVW